MEKVKQAEAIAIVRDLIRKEETRLTEIANNEEADPIMVEGFTTEDIPVHAMVSGKLVADIFLKYEYPVYHVLGEDYPDEMWLELANSIGLLEISSVDL